MFVVLSCDVCYEAQHAAPLQSILNLLKKAPSSEGTLGLEKRLIQLFLHLIRRQVATQSLVVADAEEGAAFLYLDVDQFLLQEEAEVPLEDRAAHAQLTGYPVLTVDKLAPLTGEHLLVVRDGAVAEERFRQEIEIHLPQSGHLRVRI